MHRLLRMRYIETGEACLSATVIARYFFAETGHSMEASLIGGVAAQIGLDYIHVEFYPEQDLFWNTPQRQYAVLDLPALFAELRRRGYGEAAAVHQQREFARIRSMPLDEFKAHQGIRADPVSLAWQSTRVCVPASS